MVVASGVVVGIVGVGRGGDRVGGIGTEISLRYLV